LGDRAKQKITDKVKAERGLFDWGQDLKTEETKIQDEIKKVENMGAKEVSEKINKLREMSSLSSSYLQYLESYSADSAKFKPIIDQLKKDQQNLQLNILGSIGDGKTITQKTELNQIDVSVMARKLFPDHTTARTTNDGSTAYTNHHTFTNIDKKSETVR